MAYPRQSLGRVFVGRAKIIHITHAVIARKTTSPHRADHRRPRDPFAACAIAERFNKHHTNNIIATTRLRGDRVYHDVTYGPARTCSAPIQAGDGAHRIYAAREPQPSFSLLAAIRQPQQVSRSYLPSGVMRRWNCRSNAVTTSDKSFLVDWVPRSGISPYPGANHWKITRRLFVRLAEH
jgi:hypothetical protein